MKTSIISTTGKVGEGKRLTIAQIKQLLDQAPMPVQSSTIGFSINIGEADLDSLMQQFNPSHDYFDNLSLPVIIYYMQKKNHKNSHIALALSKLDPDTVDIDIDYFEAEGGFKTPASPDEDCEPGTIYVYHVSATFHDAGDEIMFRLANGVPV